MTFEIEKRSLFTDKEKFEECQQLVSIKGQFTKTYEFKTFLFKEPRYLRIRITKGKPYAVITTKTGTYQDSAREEIEENIKLERVKDFVKELQEKGFKECVAIKTISRSYLFNNLRVDFNTIDFLGLIVEVEALTDKQEEINVLENSIVKTMELLKLKELDPKTYQKMMDEMYSKLLRPIEEQEFN